MREININLLFISSIGFASSIHSGNPVYFENTKWYFRGIWDRNIQISKIYLVTSHILPALWLVIFNRNQLVKIWFHLVRLFFDFFFFFPFLYFLLEIFLKVYILNLLKALFSEFKFIIGPLSEKMNLQIEGIK